MELKRGDVVIMNDGTKETVIGLIGKGGQGSVYEVSVGGKHKHHALKWYLPEYLHQIDQKRFYDNLVENQKSGSPSDNFLWLKSVSSFKPDSFGYLMDLRPKRYCSFSDILNAKQRITSLKTQIIAAKNICCAFQSLHRKGYSYQDINDGNFFIDTSTGDVLVCDNDNVAPCGTWMGMAGKDRYIAPEVVLGKSHAGMESDLYSLAVVLYMLFFISHPLEGRRVHTCPCLTNTYLRKFFAESPVFVYDPNDSTNRPVKGVDCNAITLWPLYPKSLQDLFVRSFTQGLHDAGYRVRENEWVDCFNQMLDNIVSCPFCGGEQFYRYAGQDGVTFPCEDCHNYVRKPFILNDGQHAKLLMEGTEILGTDIGMDCSKKIGTVVESVKHPGLWGISIQYNLDWKIECSNGKELAGNKGTTIPLFKGTTLKVNMKQMKIEM